ncbi:hypothetical protein SEA_SCHWARTZ33_82 [Gordonia phage Schwartz33]|nr:hypothetical protein SEA_SCHWARTZ33_82 [Gordonia phage Schwartz33]
MSSAEQIERHNRNDLKHKSDETTKVTVGEGIELVLFDNGEANVRHVCQRGADRRQVRISPIFRPTDRYQIECSSCGLSGEIVNEKFYYA